MHRMSMTRHKLIQEHLKLNQLSYMINKRPEPENVETLEESVYKEQLYETKASYEKQLNTILD